MTQKLKKNRQKDLLLIQNQAQLWQTN